MKESSSVYDTSLRLASLFLFLMAPALVHAAGIKTLASTIPRLIFHQPSLFRRLQTWTEALRST